MELLGAGFKVAEASIDGREFDAKAEDGDVDGCASLLAESIFGGLNHESSDAGPLVGWVDGKLA